LFAIQRVSLLAYMYGWPVRLITFTAENFRRFVKPTSIKLHADLIALIGPNEAGKSSILDAIALLSSDAPFARSDGHRRSGVLPVLKWNLQLEDGDKSALGDVPGGAAVERVEVTKTQGGPRVWAFHPKRLKRDRQPRIRLATLIRAFLAAESLDDVPRDPEDDYISRLSTVVDLLERDVEDFSVDDVNQLASTMAQMEAMSLGFEPDDARTDVDPSMSESRLALVEMRRELVTGLQAQVRSEASENPHRAATAILDARLPRVILYESEDRDLRGSYDLNEVAEATPRALGHLCELAGLKLGPLRFEVDHGHRSDVVSRIAAANEALRAVFKQNWNQEKVALQVDMDGHTLSVFALSLSSMDSGVSDLSERSDGMRWFAALLAFVHSAGEAPIILVDEIETHLHYDAQGDLVNFLGRQQFTSKVIYTTHSFGCLPPDIGTGVRLANPVDATTSELVNGFWRHGAGFSPLLTSMGAAAVSFTPSRYAVIAEGPSDAVLLPTLLRQATGRALRFQIVPGAAEVAAARVAGLTAEAGHVVFLVDGDEGGFRNRAKLIEGRVDTESIVVLQSALEMQPFSESGDCDYDADAALESEDLIDPAVYVAAVNEELRCWNDGSAKLTVSDLATNLRTKSLETWCSKNGLIVPDKVAVAERIIDYAAGEDGVQPIFDPARKGLVEQLSEDLMKRLRIP
jgi:predicted ATP-dependent endonuclease of OLD family